MMVANRTERVVDIGPVRLNRRASFTFVVTDADGLWGSVTTHDVDEDGASEQARGWLAFDVDPRGSLRADYTLTLRDAVPC